MNKILHFGVVAAIMLAAPVVAKPNFLSNPAISKSVIAPVLAPVRSGGIINSIMNLLSNILK